MFYPDINRSTRSCTFKGGVLFITHIYPTLETTQKGMNRSTAPTLIKKPHNKFYLKDKEKRESGILENTRIGIWLNSVVCKTKVEALLF